MDNKSLHDLEPLWNSWYIDNLIGEGSFGSVYKIVREEFGIKHYSALKIISIPRNKSETNQLMFEGMSSEYAKQYFKEIVEDIYNEIILMSKLKGKSNVVSYEDHLIIEHQNGIGYDILIRMELLQSLNKHAAGRVLKLKEILHLGLDICNALVLCQKHNVIHRDIKPDNIFISGDDDYKLGDFGIAKNVTLSELGMSIKGSYEYMAPEVYLGKDYDSRVDIYSLGIVLYTLMNKNRVPFLSDNTDMIRLFQRQEAVKKRLEGVEIPSLPNIPILLNRVIMKAIEYNPNNRYASAEEFLDALKSVKLVELEEYDSQASLLDSRSNFEDLSPSNTEKVIENLIDKTVLIHNEYDEIDRTVLLNDNTPNIPLLDINNKKEKDRSIFIALFLLATLTVGIFTFVFITLYINN